jgi:hypothetical protein
MGREHGERDPRDIAAHLRQWPKFKLGRTTITPNARDSLNLEDVQSALERHQRGDWGDLEAEDRQVNDDALEHGGRLVSAYSDRHKVVFWIITESDRSLTTVLLPEDY